MKAGVVKAIEQIKRHFEGHDVHVAPAPCGGAYVLVEDVTLGAPYVQASSWVGCFLTNACPEADTYPFYLRGDLARVDGAPLRTPLHVNHTWPPDAAGIAPRASVMVSRRQKNQSCWGRETPLMKLQTVLKWMRTL